MEENEFDYVLEQKVDVRDSNARQIKNRINFLNKGI
jgi:hypothetical protein